MSIGFDFIAAIVRISAIDDKYPGGLKACLSHWRARGVHLWHDDFLLFGGGTMTAKGVPALIRAWQDIGLDTHSEVDGRITQWRDICVCEAMNSPPLWNCSWLQSDGHHSGVYLAGTPPGVCVYQPPYRLDDELAAAATGEEANRRVSANEFQLFQERQELFEVLRASEKLKRMIDHRGLFGNQVLVTCLQNAAALSIVLDSITTHSTYESIEKQFFAKRREIAARIESEGLENYINRNGLPKEIDQEAMQFVIRKLHAIPQTHEVLPWHIEAVKPGES